MLNIRIIFIAVLMPLLLSGCATKWNHPTATEADFYRDKNQCLREAMQTYPPENKSYTLGGSQTNCSGYGNTINCTTTPPVRVQQADYSGINRGVYIDNCLRGKGYYHASSSTASSSPSQATRTGVDGIRLDMNAEEVAKANGCESPFNNGYRREGNKEYTQFFCGSGAKIEVMCDSSGCFIN